MIPIPQYPLYTAIIAEFNAYAVSSIQQNLNYFSFWNDGRRQDHSSGVRYL